MIVCGRCGLSAHRVGAECTMCTGRGVDLPTPAKNILSQTQGNKSPQTDRWSKSYTTSPGGTPKSTTPPAAPSRSNVVAPSPLQRKHSENVTMDVRMDHEGELARVYGSVLDPHIVFPECSSCKQIFRQGEKQYEPKNLPADVKEVMCRTCYGQKFATWHCLSCDRAIIGDLDEGCGGKWFKSRLEGLGWHARCCKCTDCGTHLYPATDGFGLTPGNEPCCNECMARFLESPKHSAKLTKAKTKYPMPAGRDNPGGMSSRAFKSTLPAPTHSPEPAVFPPGKGKPRSPGAKVISHMKTLFGEKDKEDPVKEDAVKRKPVKVSPVTISEPVTIVRTQSTVTETGFEYEKIIETTRTLLTKSEASTDAKTKPPPTPPKPTAPLRLHTIPFPTIHQTPAPQLRPRVTSARKPVPLWAPERGTTSKADKRQSAPPGRSPAWPPSDVKAEKSGATSAGKVTGRWPPADTATPTVVSDTTETRRRRVSFSSKQSEFPADLLIPSQPPASNKAAIKPLPTLPSVIRSRPSTPANLNPDVPIPFIGAGLERAKRVSHSAKDIEKAIQDVQDSERKLKRWSVPIKIRQVELVSTPGQATSLLPLPATPRPVTARSQSYNPSTPQRSPDCGNCGISTDCVALKDRQLRDGVTKVLVVEGKAYHASCLPCATCGAPLSSDGVKSDITMENGSPIHQKCATPPKSAPEILCPTPKRPSKLDIQGPDALLHKPTSVVDDKPKNSTESRKSPIFNVPVVPLASTTAPLPKTLAATDFGDRPHPHAQVFASQPGSVNAKLKQLGGMLVCPGCTMKIGPMESGLIGGPKGSKWHKTCLRCGNGEGKGVYVHKTPAQRKRENVAGCGKLLDASADLDEKGVVWCKGCRTEQTAAAKEKERAGAGAVKAPPATVTTRSKPVPKPVNVPQPAPVTPAVQPFNFRGLLSPTNPNQENIAASHTNEQRSTSTSAYHRIDKQLRTKTAGHVKRSSTAEAAST